MKGCEVKTFGKVFLTFPKWTKKMSKNQKPKHSLLTKKLPYHIEKLSSQINLQIFFCDCIFLNKKLKNFFFRKYNGNRGNADYAKKTRIFLSIM